MIIKNFNFITDIIDKGNSSIIVLTGEQLSGKSVLLDKIKAY